MQTFFMQQQIARGAKKGPPHDSLCKFSFSPSINSSLYFNYWAVLQLRWNELITLLDHKIRKIYFYDRRISALYGRKIEPQI